MRSILPVSFCRLCRGEVRGRTQYAAMEGQHAERRSGLRRERCEVGWHVATGGCVRSSPYVPAHTTRDVNGACRAERARRRASECLRSADAVDPQKAWAAYRRSRSRVGERQGEKRRSGMTAEPSAVIPPFRLIALSLFACSLYRVTASRGCRRASGSVSIARWCR